MVSGQVAFASKCETFQECVVLQDRWSRSSGLSRPVLQVCIVIDELIVSELVENMPSNNGNQLSVLSAHQ